MPSQYIPVFLFALIAASFPIAAFLLLNRGRKQAGVLDLPVPEEASQDLRAPLGRPEPRSKQLPAAILLFVIFDAATIFLLLWAIKFSELGVYGFLAMLIFLGILSTGFVVVWRLGVFDENLQKVEQIGNGPSGKKSS